MYNREVAHWIVPLVGHQFDLEDLPFWFAGQPVHVTKRGDTFFLAVPSEVIGTNHEPVRAFAVDQLELINGIGRLLSPSFRPLSLADILFGVDSVGNVVNTVVAIGGSELRVKGGTLQVAVGGQVQRDPREGAALPLTRAASKSSRGRDALVIVGRPNLTWSELYLLFELVEAEVGSRMFDLAWISRADANLFTRTANSYSALRSEGRHGKDKGDPPPQPMQHDVAVKLMAGLVSAWLLDLGATNPNHKAG